MKDYAAIYDSENDASSLEQKWYLKQESVRGVLAVPTDTDYFYALEGGTIDYSQPFDESPQRSGRHLNNIVKSKKTLSWGFQTFINIDEAVSPGGPTEIDQAVRTLWTSLMGREYVRVSGPDPFDGLEYSNNVAPSTSFSLFSVVDKFAQQSRGNFVQSGNFSFPGDGQAQIDWAGNGKDALTIGLAKSVIDNNAGTTVTVGVGEGRQMKPLGLVMIIKADGVTRSTDSLNGTALVVKSIAGDVITLEDTGGSPLTLADADGSGTPVYLVYYEPENPIAIDNPIVGLRGQFIIDGLPPQSCVRSLTVNMTNGHELIDYCAGEDSLGDSLFVPGDRFRADVELTLNMNTPLVAFFRDVEEFVFKDIDSALGDVLGRHFRILLPRVIFPVPPIPVPGSGSIPVTFAGGKALQTALGAADECQPSFR